jgi:AcrR family transcriptional regulator
VVQESRRGTYAKGVARRQEIVDRALEVFHELGSDRTSLRSIAEALGVTHAALRHYFGSREQLFLEVLRQADARAREALTEQAAESAAGFTSVIAEIILREPGLMALYNAMVARGLERDNAESKDFFVERYRGLRKDLRSLLEAGRAAGVVREDIDLDAAAALIVAASDGLSTQWLLDEDVDMTGGMAVLDALLSPPK